MRFVRALFCAGAVWVCFACAGFDQESFKETKEQAEKGDPEAEMTLGLMYHLGDGVAQNYGEALTWYRRASDHGNAIAQHNLGIMYLKGQGVPVNPMEGAKWVRRSADQGNPRAQMTLGALFAQGKGVPQNYVQALAWSRRAAEQGDATAQENLGEIYRDGEWTRADFVEAYKWFSLSSAQSNSDAATARDEVARKMSPQQIKEGQRLSATFVAKKEPGTANTPRASGTGFFVTKDGYFMTANHVVDDASRIVIKTRVLSLAARVVKVDKANDLALLKVIGAYPALGTNRSSYLAADARIAPVVSKFRPLAVVDSAGKKLGESISTLGFPNPEFQGSEPKFTRGEINSLAGLKDDPRRFQISAQIQPGNSGGPLLDSSGNVIGIIQSSLAGLGQLLTTGLMPQNVNYALKSSHILAFLKSVPGLTLADPQVSDVSNLNWVSEAQSSVAVILVY